MKETLKKYFVPHEGNQYRPHFLRETAAHFLILIVVVSFIGSFAMQTLADNSSIVPTILPDVLVTLTNQDRAAQNLPTLSTNPKLIDAATLKSEDMAQYQYFAHTSPAGVTPWAWFQKVGYRFLYAGENLAIGFTQSQDVETAWMNSPEHRANILSTNFEEIGIAATGGIYQGHSTIYVVQLFGTPAVSQFPLPITVAPTTVLPAAQAVTAKPAPTPAPEVKGASVEIPAAASAPQPTEQAVNVITQGPTYTEVKAADPDLAAAPTITAPAVQTQKVSWADEFILDPSILLKTIYLVLGLIVLIALVMHVVIEIEHQHPPSLVYGSFILILMGGLYLASIHFFGTSVVFS